VQDLPAALHRLGLTTRLGAIDHHHVEPPPSAVAPDRVSGLNNSAALVAYGEQLSDVVGQVLDRGSFPLVLGGDCSITFGPLLALARRGASGYLFLDGHADFAHPSTEPSGEAASMDLALATGRGPSSFGPIGGYRRLVADTDIAVLGYRAEHDGTDRCLDEHINDTAITAINLEHSRRRGWNHAVAVALGVVDRPTLDGFWIHIDADVLDDAVMPAVDYRTPGGLTWDELTGVVRTAIATGRVRGLDFTIFNPRLDHDGIITARVVDFLVDCLT
jgi:arginase